MQLQNNKMVLHYLFNNGLSNVSLHWLLGSLLLFNYSFCIALLYFNDLSNFSDHWLFCLWLWEDFQSLWRFLTRHRKYCTGQPPPFRQTEFYCGCAGFSSVKVISRNTSTTVQVKVVPGPVPCIQDPAIVYQTDC